MILSLFLLVCGAAMAQMQVTGTVVLEDDNEPAFGASIHVVGAGTGVVADANGNFSLSVPQGAKLRISYTGYESQEVTARPKLRVVLQSSNMLQEQVILGYGSAKKLGTFSGAVATVGSQKLEMAVTPNFTDALAGQVSGLSVLSSSGEPTQSASIRLRGINSIFSSNTPLFILDGAPISSAIFNTLNPADIANITVIKDASGTAIYGSRAANGVIVITTKRGRFGEKANVTLRAQYGWSNPISDGIEMMNSNQYIKFRDLIGQPVSDDIRNLVDKYGINTNWRDEMFHTAPTYTLDATISGGSETVAYRLSLNHHDQEGIVEQSGMNRNTLSANIDARVNEWLRVGVQTNLGVNNYEYNSENSADDLYTSDPMLFQRLAFPYDASRYYTIDDATGNIVWGDKAERLFYSNLSTPKLINKYRDIDRKRTTLNLNAYEQITPISGLTLRAQQALDGYETTTSGVWFPYETYNTPMGTRVQGRDGSASTAFTRYYSYTYTNTAEYKFNLDRHHFSVLAGQESIITKSRSFSAYSEGQTDERQMRLTDGTTVSIDDLGDSRAEEVFNSFFGQLNYNWADKYYVDASLRTDGSSRFAPGHRWGTFWALGGMWNAKKEEFLKGVKWLDELQVRVNYGTSGNASGAGSYDYFGLIGTGSRYNGETSLAIASPSNSTLTWEKVAAFDLGFTARFFNRFGLSVDFYNKKTSDMLMSIPYSMTTGFASGQGNIGAMVNRGVDIDFDVNIMRQKDIDWTFKANFNYNHNEITELFAGRDEYVLADYGLNMKVGRAWGEFYYVRNAGVDPRDGKSMWYDKDGNLTKVYNEERDAVFTGKNQYAPISGGFGTSFRWKGLTVSMDFQWQAKKYLINNDNYFVKNANMGTSYNQATDMLHIWTKPGDITDIPAYGEAIQFDTHLIENASFLRLKALNVQYLLPRSIVARTNFFEQVKIFGVARNLFTITKFTGYDPEPDANLVAFNYPNTRQFVLGIEVTF